MPGEVHIRAVFSRMCLAGTSFGDGSTAGSMGLSPRGSQGPKWGLLQEAGRLRCPISSTDHTARPLNTDTGCTPYLRTIVTQQPMNPTCGLRLNQQTTLAPLILTHAQGCFQADCGSHLLRPKLTRFPGRSRGVGHPAYAWPGACGSRRMPDMHVHAHAGA